MTTYVDPTAPSTTIYGVTDGTPGVEEVLAVYPDFSFSEMIGAPVFGDYALQSYANFPFGFVYINGKTAAGDITFSIKVDGVAVQGLSDITINAARQQFQAVPGQGVSIGQRLSIDMTSGSAPANFEFTLACARS